MSTNHAVYEGSCLCGEIKVKVVGPPAVAGLCHCETCRTWHAAPVNAFSIWLNEAVSIVQGEELLASYQAEKCKRHWCQNCGSGLINHLRNDMTAVYAMVLDGSGYVHQPGFHIYCEASVFDLQDGLPKFFDLPAELGGSGETVEEPSQTGIRSSSD